MTRANSTLIGNNHLTAWLARTSQINGLCLAARGKQMQTAFGRMAFELLTASELANESADEPKPAEKPKAEEEKEEEKKEGDQAAEKPAEEKKEEPKEDKPAEAKEGEKPAEAAKTEEKPKTLKKIYWMVCRSPSSDRYWQNSLLHRLGTRLDCATQL